LIIADLLAREQQVLSWPRSLHCRRFVSVKGLFLEGQARQDGLIARGVQGSLFLACWN